MLGLTVFSLRRGRFLQGASLGYDFPDMIWHGRNPFVEETVPIAYLIYSLMQGRLGSALLSLP